jgi:hypothetical protein
VTEALFQFQEHCNGAGYGQRAKRQGDRGRPVVWRKQTKTAEQKNQPEDQQLLPAA